MSIGSQIPTDSTPASSPAPAPAPGFWWQLGAAAAHVIASVLAAKVAQQQGQGR